MTIDITQAPPTDIFRDRGKHLWISIALLSLAACGMLLILYVIFADAPQSDTLETTALSLFVGPALIFVYFGEKLKAYKKLGPEQKKGTGRSRPQTCRDLHLLRPGGQRRQGSDFCRVRSLQGLGGRRKPCAVKLLSYRERFLH